MLSSIPDAARSAKLYSALGYTYEQQKQYKNAITAYRKAIELDHDNLDAIRGLAQNLMNDGQTDAALEQYKIIADANPEDAQTYLRMAEIYRKSGKFDQALESLKKARSMVQDSIEVPYNMAAVYQAQGRYDEAIQVLQDLLKKTEKTDNSYTQAEKNNRSVFLERLGTIYRDNNNDARQSRLSARCWPSATRTPYAATSRSSTPTAKPSSGSRPRTPPRKRCRSCPMTARLKMVYAAQLADMGQPDAGLQQVKSLLKGTPEDRDVYITLAQMYSRLKRWPEAEETLDKAEPLSTKEEDKHYVYFLRGSTYERQKKYEPAEEMFRKVLANDPQNATALNYLGYMLADRGRQAGRSPGHDQEGGGSRPRQRRLPGFAGLGLLQAGQVRIRGRQPDQGLTAYRHRSDGAGSPRRSLPEDRTPEAGGGALGARALGVEQDRSRGSRSERRGPGSEKTRIRQDEAGQRRLRQQIITTDHVGAGLPLESRPSRAQLGFLFVS